MITLRLQGHPAAPLQLAVGQDDETGEVTQLVAGDLKSGICVEITLSEDHRRQLLQALQGKPIIETASALPPMPPMRAPGSRPSPNGA